MALGSYTFFEKNRVKKPIEWYAWCARLQFINYGRDMYRLRFKLSG